MNPLLSALKDNKGNVAWSAVMLVMVLGAYLAQADKIEALSLEVGELRATAKYQEQRFFYINSKQCFTINETDNSDQFENYRDKDMERFLRLLFSRIKEETMKIKNDVTGYNYYLEKNLSYMKDLGEK